MPTLDQLFKLPENEALTKLDEIIDNEPKLVALRAEIRETRTSVLLQNIADPNRLSEKLLGADVDNLSLTDLVGEAGEQLEMRGAAMLKVLYDEIDRRIPIPPVQRCNMNNGYRFCKLPLGHTTSTMVDDHDFTD